MKATESTESAGLGSLSGIRWLLAVGALVLAVSVYRLVESQWAGMPVTAQFLTLVAGALGVFGAGELLRDRVRLPIAGSALSLLFSVLVPVLSWGAAYLNLLGAPAGAVVYAISMVGLLGAFRRCLRETLRYHGVSYPLAFSLLTVSLPLLAITDLTSEWGAIVVALGLGSVFHLGARHINRFAFHRDRRDGIDRPVHALPFIALAALYVAGLAAASFPARLVALPLLVGGLVLVTTGEEYYHALVKSLRVSPSRWPRRSLALLAIGFSLMAIAAPLAFLDSGGQVVAIVFVSLAALLFRWSFRYGSVAAHIVAMSSSVVAYPFLSTLLPQLAREKVVSLVDLLGLTTPAASSSFAHLGLALFFTFLGRRAGRTHAIGSTVHLVLVVALSGIAGAKIVAPLALALALLSVFLNRREEWLVAAHAALGASILAWGGAHGMELVAVAMMAIAALGRESRFVLSPAFFWAVVVGISGLIGFADTGAFEVLLAGGILLLLGRRLHSTPALVPGLAASSLGIHGLLAFTYDAPTIVLVATTQTIFLLSVLWWRRAKERWALVAHVSVVGHGAAGLLWLAAAIGSSTVAVTIEPVILALFGWAIFTHGLKDADETDIAAGLAFLVTYLPFQLAAMALVTLPPLLLLFALGGLLVARFLAPSAALSSVERFLRYWRVTAIVIALCFIGIEALALAAAIVLVGVLDRRFPRRSLLLLLAHGFVWIEGAARLEFFPLTFVSAAASGFPLLTVIVLGWIVAVEFSREEELGVWITSLECLVAAGFLMDLAPVDVFSGWAKWECSVLVAVAAAFAARHAARAIRHESYEHAWGMQAWLGLGVLAGYYAGWVTFGNGRAPYVLIASGALEYGLAALCRRRNRGETLASTSVQTGQALALLGGMVALVRMQSMPLFLASLFYLLVGSREPRRIFASILSAGFLGLGLLAIAWSHGVGAEFYALAPGFTLVALALLLSEEMGPRWSRHVFTAGAAFLYATPVLALYDEITWTWQAVLLLLTVGFGAASFWLRSRPLLTVSTAALVVDLACFVIKIRATEPLLLWVGGVLLGIALMTVAAYLEYRREGLAQQIRVFGRELAGWY